MYSKGDKKYRERAFSVVLNYSQLYRWKKNISRRPEFFAVVGIDSPPTMGIAAGERLCLY
jgi:hypothetical protein